MKLKDRGLEMHHKSYKNPLYYHRLTIPRTKLTYELDNGELTFYDSVNDKKVGSLPMEGITGLGVSIDNKIIIASK